MAFLRMSTGYLHCHMFFVSCIAFFTGHYTKPRNISTVAFETKQIIRNKSDTTENNKKQAKIDYDGNVRFGRVSARAGHLH